MKNTTNIKKMTGKMFLSTCHENLKPRRHHNNNNITDVTLTKTSPPMTRDSSANHRRCFIPTPYFPFSFFSFYLSFDFIFLFFLFNSRLPLISIYRILSTFIGFYFRVFELTVLDFKIFLFSFLFVARAQVGT
jgi:hypothetical protein